MLSRFGHRRASRPAPTVTPKLRLEALESREVPANFNIPNGNVQAFITAINICNTNNQPDTINLAANGSYTFTTVADAADGGNALPTIAADPLGLNPNPLNTITINGNGATLTRGPGAPNMRFFRLTEGFFVPGHLILNDATLTGGSAAGAGLAGDGGAIFFSGGGTAELTNCNLVNNQATGDGGAISTFNSSPNSLTLTHCNISNNKATGTLSSGGGLFNHFVTVTIADSTFNNNTCAASGAGIWNQGGTLTISGTTISNNTSTRDVDSGGGIFTQGDLNLYNSTINGNRAGSGGGIDFASGNAVIANSTIAGNSAFFALASGAGVIASGMSFTLHDTIVAQNTFDSTVTTGSGPDVSTAGTFRITSQGYNLIGDGTGAMFTMATGDQIGTAAAPIDPKLGPLQNNGGPTPTRFLLSGSPAIDKGDPAFAPPIFAPPGNTDQRGTGFPRVANGRVDIGALEVPAPNTTHVAVTVGGSPGIALPGDRVTFSVVVRNLGTAAVTNATFSDPAPLGVSTFTWVATAAGGATVLPASGTGDINVPITLPVGSSVTFTITATIAPSASVSVTNLATITGFTDIDPSANTGFAMIAIVSNPTPTVGATGVYAVGSGPGSLPIVSVFDTRTGGLRLQFLAFDRSFRGGVRVAMGDVNGDGVPDVIVGAGPGGGPVVKVFDGTDGFLLEQFFAYAPNFTGGVFVAATDFNRSGHVQIITGADAGGGPHVRVFSSQTGQILRSFYAFAPNFTGGVRVAAGDVDGDGVPDLIAAAGPGGVPVVEAFSGRTGALIRYFVTGFGNRFRGGIYVTAGDAIGNGHADIIVGAGDGGPRNVLVYDGQSEALLANFVAFPSLSNGLFANPLIDATGVRVAVLTPTGGGPVRVVAATGPGRAARIRVFNVANLSVVSDLQPFDPNFLGGVYVG